MKSITLWSIIAFCRPVSVSEDFVLTITTFSSSPGQFYEAIYFFWMTGMFKSLSPQSIKCTFYGLKCPHFPIILKLKFASPRKNIFLLVPRSEIIP